MSCAFGYDARVPRRARVLTAVATFAALTGSADAGRRPFGWLDGTEVLPERGAEIETWIFEENGKRRDEKSTLMAWAATIGVTDHLELSLPAEWRWTRADDRAASFTFTRFGAEARYRFVSQDPVDAPPLAPLVRVALYRVVAERDVVRPEVDAVVAYTAGRVQLGVDVGVVGEVGPDATRFEVRPAAGISVEAITDLRFGAEAYAQLDFDDGERSWAAVGPNVAWTHGRFWLAASYGIGVYQIRNAPRIAWGLAF